MQLILFSKPDCHLCEGLQEKLEQIEFVSLEIRDITENEEWFQRYQYEVPVLFAVDASGGEHPIPRPSPRSNVAQLQQMLQKYDSVSG
ncbi:MAG: glutaredoxin family protein [Phormidium sp. BM_Day4_Bin.17]|nr:glutaredoxin family protein [Phormidium sp. BM_Day4_Bin.17]UCJ10753.1 MAG: glutaredoxin family protein [Phormidium sp. PBR-2020]